MVSEISFVGKWLERHDADECRVALDRAEALGINILGCRMRDTKLPLK